MIREIKGIYSALVLIEAKCIQVDRAQAAAIKAHERGELAVLEDNWPSLLSLHRTVMHDHHDFLLASQHVAAPPSLKELAVKYSMPARMWEHGIHSFLELLRYRLPSSKEFMLSFLYFAYQMMCLLYETVPSFQTTWMECPGDLSRYRMAIEDIDKQDRDNWAAMARYWYNKTADRCPNVGRLYHHLAILARPSILRQLYLYGRSLTSVVVFHSNRESMETIFDQVQQHKLLTGEKHEPVDIIYAKIHEAVLHNTTNHETDHRLSMFFDLVRQSIPQRAMRWREDGAHIAISNIAAFLSYGRSSSAIRAIFDTSSDTEDVATESSTSTSEKLVREGESKACPSGHTELSQAEADSHHWATDLLIGTLREVLSCIEHDNSGTDLNVLPHLHIVLVFIWSLASRIDPSTAPTSAYLESFLILVPWCEICTFLNALSYVIPVKSETINNPSASLDLCEEDILPEDHLMRGSVYTQSYLPLDLFVNTYSSEERAVESSQVVHKRASRLHWLASRSALSRWLVFDTESRNWQTNQSPVADNGASLALPKLEELEDYETLVNTPDSADVSGTGDTMSVSSGHTSDWSGSRISRIDTIQTVDSDCLTESREDDDGFVEMVTPRSSLYKRDLAVWAFNSHDVPMIGDRRNSASGMRSCSPRCDSSRATSAGAMARTDFDDPADCIYVSTETPRELEPATQMEIMTTG